MKIKLMATVALLATAVLSQAGIVYSNSAAPGDFFTNPNPGGTFQAIGTSGHLYNNVRSNAVIGINTNNARSGNGSVYMEITADGNSKADIEFYNVDNNGLAAMGTLGTLTALSYDWYRSSASTTNSIHAPAFRILIDADGDMSTANDRGFLAYEYTYTTAGAAPTDSWVSDDLFGNDKNFWQRVSPNNYDQIVNIKSLSTWSSAAGFTPSWAGNTGLNFDADSAIYGYSIGLGSGWSGSYFGAIDNVTFGFNGISDTTNFEAVPEPFTMATLGLAFLAARRKKKAKS